MKTAACGIVAVMVVLLLVGGHFASKEAHSYTNHQAVAQAAQDAEIAKILGEQSK